MLRIIGWLLLLVLAGVSGSASAQTAKPRTVRLHINGFSKSKSGAI